MRADRLLTVIGLLQTSEKLTAEEMANEFGVSVRTIYRDIEALCMAGIPVIAESGPFGGFSLPSGYKSNVNVLMNADLYPLVLRQLGTVWRDLKLKRVDDAILKMLGAVPQQHKSRLLQLRDRFLIDHVAWFADGIPADSFLTIEAATMNDQTLEAMYEDAGGTILECVIEPYGMVSKAGVWYLIARNDAVFKTYRISRFLNVQNTGVIFDRIEDFALHEYWEKSVHQYKSSLGEEVDVKLHVDPDFLRKLPQFLGEEARSSVHHASKCPSSGWYIIDWTFESTNTMTSRILSMGPYVRLIEPNWAVNLVYETVLKVAELYQKEEK